MTPKEALDRLRSHPEDRDAWAEIDRLLHALVQRETREENYREQALFSVRGKLEDQLLSGDLAEILAPAAYFARALRWRVRDAVRKGEREARSIERNVQQAEALVKVEALAPEPFGAELIVVIETVFERAVTMRDPDQRDPLRRALSQIRALNTEPRTLREIVCADDGLDPVDTTAVALAVQRAHKAHQRARIALTKALAWLVERGRIDPETGDAVRVALVQLKRRQDRVPPRVSGTQGTEHAR
jgi:hypothetical protein